VQYGTLFIILFPSFDFYDAIQEVINPIGLVSDLLAEPCVSGETEEVPTQGLRLSDVEPLMPGATKQDCTAVLAIVLLVTAGVTAYLLYC